MQPGSKTSGVGDGETGRSESDSDSGLAPGSRKRALPLPAKCPGRKPELAERAPNHRAGRAGRRGPAGRGPQAPSCLESAESRGSSQRAGHHPAGDRVGRPVWPLRSCRAIPDLRRAAVCVVARRRRPGDLRALGARSVDRRGRASAGAQRIYRGVDRKASLSQGAEGRDSHPGDVWAAVSAG